MCNIGGHDRRDQQLSISLFSLPLCLYPALFISAPSHRHPITLTATWSLPRSYKELEAYVNERREALATPATPQAGKFVTQAELMGEDEPKAGGKRSGKGFA